MTESAFHSPIQQRLIGLTGGIGMGKTAVSDYLSKVHHLPILDTDLFARDAVAPGSLILTEIAERYGSGILLPDGSLNRSRLGDIVFNSAPERLWLEQQIHPYVYDRLQAAIHTHPLNDPTLAPIVVIVVPLLFEARMTDLVTEIWVVYSTQTQQIERLAQRDHHSPEQVAARIQSQLAIEKKLERADVILKNTANLSDLYQQIDAALSHPQES
jgi:dephospho-CoA kinase